MKHTQKQKKNVCDEKTNVSSSNISFPHSSGVVLLGCNASKWNKSYLNTNEWMNAYKVLKENSLLYM